MLHLTLIRGVFRNPIRDHSKRMFSEKGKEVLKIENTVKRGEGVKCIVDVRVEVFFSTNSVFDF